VHRERHAGPFAQADLVEPRLVTDAGLNAKIESGALSCG